LSDLIVIGGEALTARINPLGAELWSLADAEGREYMTSADPAYWTGHAPLLFPIVGALNGGSYRLDGIEYALPKHGFARTSRFAVADAGPDRARFELRDDEQSRAAYPFEFVLAVEFALSGATLTVTATVRNASDRAMPFSFGFHPALAWPLPAAGRKDAHRVIFAANEPEPIRRIDPATATLLPRSEPTPVVGNVLAPTAALFEKDALIWDRLNSRALSFSGDGATIDIAFPDSPNLGIWQKPGAPFLAIEPWHGFNDPQGFEGDIFAKPGIIALPPGEERSFRMDVTVRRG
jgi:galactose mutarotase-like enzyme